MLQHRKIVGGPGSGKSTRIAQELSSLPDDIRPHEMLCVMFNRDARDAFKDKLRQTRVQGADVRTLHSLAYMLYKHHSTSSAKPPLQVLRAMTVRALQQNPTPHFLNMRFQLLFVDEAQDLTENDVVILQHVLRQTGAKIWLAGDIPQAINMFQGSNARYFQEWPVDHESILDKSHRCTPEILDVVNALRVAAPMQSHKPPGGPRPVLVRGTDLDIQEYMYEKIKALDLSTTRVGIVGPGKKMGQVNVGLNATLTWLQNWGIPYERHYEFSTSDSPSNVREKRVSLENSMEKVHVHTVHSSKGLTFDICFCIDVHEFARGKISCETKETEVRNLFHVGTSRAAMELHMFCRNTTPIFKDLWKCWPSLQVKGDNVACPTPRTFGTQSVHHNLTAWTTYLKTPTVASERVLLEMQTAWDVAWEPVADASSNTFPSDVDTELAPVLGTFAENVLEYAYTGLAPPCIVQIKEITSVVMELPPELPLHDLGNIWQESSLHLVKSDVLRRKLSTLPQITPAIQAFIDRVPTDDNVMIHVQDPRVITQFFDRGYLLALVNAETYGPREIWKACLFLYQYEAQAIVLWQKYEVLGALPSIAEIYTHLTTVAATLPSDMEFQKAVHWPRLRLHGVIDAYHPPSKTLYEFKFSPDPVANHLQYALQVLGYREMLGRRQVADYTCEVWNLCTLEKCRVRATTCKRRRWQIEKILLESLQRQLHHPIWCYDLETQGFFSAEVGIVEIHLEDYETGVCPLSTLVYQPSVPLRASQIHHIYAQDLVGKPSIQKVSESLRELLGRCSRPSLVAYNGEKFDDKFVKRDLLFGHENVVWRDSLKVTKHAAASHPPPPPSFRLEAAYHFYVGNVAGTAHRAEADVEMMIELMHALNISPEMLQ